MSPFKRFPFLAPMLMALVMFAAPGLGFAAEEECSDIFGEKKKCMKTKWSAEGGAIATGAWGAGSNNGGQVTGKFVGENGGWSGGRDLGLSGSLGKVGDRITGGGAFTQNLKLSDPKLSFASNQVFDVTYNNGRANVLGLGLAYHNDSGKTTLLADLLNFHKDRESGAGAILNQGVRVLTQQDIHDLLAIEASGEAALLYGISKDPETKKTVEGNRIIETQTKPGLDQDGLGRYLAARAALVFKVPAKVLGQKPFVRLEGLVESTSYTAKSTNVDGTSFDSREHGTKLSGTGMLSIGLGNEHIRR